MGIELPETRLRVWLNDRPASELVVALQPGWNEHVLALPATLITGDSARLRLAGRLALGDWVTLTLER